MENDKRLDEIKDFIRNDKKIMSECRNTIATTALTTILIDKKIISMKEYQKMYEELLNDYVDRVAQKTLESLLKEQEAKKEV